MILCPNCHHEELPGALFCSECGTRLISIDHLTTQSLQKSPSDMLDSKKVSPPKEPLMAGKNSPDAESQISINIIDINKSINLAGRNEFTFGRVAEGQPILPDVDLTPFDAYSQGVSRLHAALRVSKNRVTIMDLGSSNGTRVNGQKIVPHVDYPINHGDIIAFGKLKIQVIIR